MARCDYLNTSIPKNHANTVLVSDQWFISDPWATIYGMRVTDDPVWYAYEYQRICI